MHPCDISKMFQIIAVIDPEALVLPHNNANKQIVKITKMAKTDRMDFQSFMDMNRLSSRKLSAISVQLLFGIRCY